MSDEGEGSATAVGTVEGTHETIEGEGQEGREPSGADEGVRLQKRHASVVTVDVDTSTALVQGMLALGRSLDNRRGHAYTVEAMAVNHLGPHQVEVALVASTLVEPDEPPPDVADHYDRLPTKERVC